MDSASFGYQAAQRSYYSAGGSSLERGMSYRESHDGRAITKLGPNFGGSVSMGQGEIHSLSQVLSLDLIPSPEQKYARQMELRRATVAATGVQSEAYGNVPPKPLEHQTIEELRRIKVILSENASRGRERSRALSEAILKLEKYRTLVHTRKRARAEGSLHERPMTPLSIERTSGNPPKSSFCPSPSHANVADNATPKQEDKGKGMLPNKRVRTSMVDVRLEGRGNASGFQRASGMVDHDRDSFKSSGSVTGFVEDKERTISVGVEGWEKAKMKGRRSGSKFESNIANHTHVPLEAEREHKWMPTHRISQENRSRLSEGHGYRCGPVHGVMSMHKAENTQQNVMQMPRMVHKMEHDGSASLGEKLDRSVFPDKERLFVKTGMKASTKDENPLLSPTALGKAKPVRAPRSSSGVPVNPSVQSSRPSAPDVWDRTGVRQQAPAIPTTHKRASFSRSSSPPVAQWVGQRPQKIARIARRVNLVPPICTMPIVDEVITVRESNPPHDSSGMATNGECSNPSISPSMNIMKRVNNSAPNISQVKLKSERATTHPSDSEASEGGDVKTKEKWKQHIDGDVRFAVISSQKMAPVTVSSKKSRLVSKEEGGDGIRRQGRSSRGLVAVRESCFVNQVLKGDTPSNVKQLRSTRPGTEKPEKANDMLPCSKPGRPPTKKGTADHRALMRPQRPIPSASGDISGKSDNDHEDLCAAIQASINFSAAACSSIFWKEVECYFRYLTPSDLESLRKEVNQLEEMEASLSLMVDNPKDVIVEGTSLDSPRLDASIDNTHIRNGSIEIDALNVTGKNPNANHHMSLWPVRKQIPLSQRLLAALIVDFDGNGDENACHPDSYPWYGSSVCTYMETNKNDELESVLEIERGCDSKMSNGWVKDLPHEKGYMINGHRQCDHEASFASLSVNARRRKEGDLQCNGPDSTDEYRSLSLDERIALELRSVGMFPDSLESEAMEDDEITEEVEKSHTELKNQVHINKDHLSSLERAILDVRPAEERDRERLAMSKLIEIAFIKRVGGRGTVVGMSGIKSSASKSARAAALSFAKRTLSRWQQYIETGKSCFCDPTLRKTLFCIFSQSGDPSTNINVREDEVKHLNSSKLKVIGSDHANLEGCGHRLLLTSPDEKADGESFDSGQVAATSSDCKDEVWSPRPEKRLDDVGVVLGGAKGKRSERERDGKSQEKENASKATRQGVGGIKEERKPKTKPRQKAAPLFKAVSGLLEKPLEDDAPKSSKSNDESLPQVLGAESGEGEVLDLTHLQIPSIDDLGGQGQDLGSWLDFEDPGLPDAGGDLMGLDIPMDDLADLAMMM